MNLDTNKTYTFAGDEYKFIHGCWRTGSTSRLVSEGDFQHFANRGLVAEPREPRVIKGTVRAKCFGLELPVTSPMPEGTWDVTFTATEVL